MMDQDELDLSSKKKGKKSDESGQKSNEVVAPPLSGYFHAPPIHGVFDFHCATPDESASLSRIPLESPEIHDNDATHEIANMAAKAQDSPKTHDNDATHDDTTQESENMARSDEELSIIEIKDDNSIIDITEDSIIELSSDSSDHMDLDEPSTYYKAPTKDNYHYDPDDDRDSEDRVLLPINTQEDEFYFRTTQKFKKYLEERREVVVRKRPKPLPKTNEYYQSDFHSYVFMLTEEEIEEDMQIIKAALSN